MGTQQEETEFRPRSKGGPAPLLHLAARVLFRKPWAMAPPPGSSEALTRFSLPTFLCPQPDTEDPFSSLSCRNPACFLRPNFSYLGTASLRVVAICLVSSSDASVFSCLVSPGVVAALEWWQQNHGLILLCPSVCIASAQYAQGPVRSYLRERGLPLGRHFPFLITHLALFPSAFPESSSSASVSPSSRKSASRCLKLGNLPDG